MQTHFRKRPVEIEAWRYDGRDYPNWPDWLKVDSVIEQTNTLRIKTLEGEMTARIGDWILRGAKGELYPCKPDIFAATYEPV